MRSQMPVVMLACTIGPLRAYVTRSAISGPAVAMHLVTGLTLAPALPSTKVIG